MSADQQKSEGIVEMTDKEAALTVLRSVKAGFQQSYGLRRIVRTVPKLCPSRSK